VAEDPGQIRQAIDETRAEIAGTVQALGEKADVKGRLDHAVAEKTSELKSRASELQGTVSELLPGSDPAKKRAAMWVAGTLLILAVIRRRKRRRHG
jgi:hypothetical protein